MIYVTVSGLPLPFMRLIKKMDEIAGNIQEEVIIQSGVDYTAKQAKYAKYFSRKEADQLIERARLVISHAGIGTIICAIQSGTPLIIVPRLKKFNEHYNDHQLEIADAMQQRAGIKVIYDVDELNGVLAFSEIPQIGTGKAKLVETIKSYVEKCFPAEHSQNTV